MAVRSSTMITSLGVAAACTWLGACVHSSGPGTAGLSARDMPELGDPMPVASAVAAAPLLPDAGPRRILARMDLDTPVSRLCADPKAKAVLDTDLPGLTTRPEYPFFKNMSLNRLKKMSHGKMSDADLAKVRAELALLDTSDPLNGAK